MSSYGRRESEVSKGIQLFQVWRKQVGPGATLLDWAYYLEQAGTSLGDIYTDEEALEVFAVFYPDDPSRGFDELEAMAWP